MTGINLEEIRQALARHNAHVTPFKPERRRASVALVLAGCSTGLRLCLIRRAEREGDPWSGHMALPGGRASPQDPSPRHVAERETEEEVGLALGEPQLIAPLSEMPVRIGGRETGMTLSPFVYHLGREPALLSPNGEVAEAFWMPLAHLWNESNHTHLNLEREGRSLLYPAINYEGHIIWGLTLRVLTLFSDVLDRPLPHLEQIPGLGH